MSVSAAYLEATVTAAAVARERGDLEVFVNISQLTVSQMSLTEMTDSRQQRQHWLGEQALNWAGLPVVHVRATVFLQHFFFLDWAAESIARDATIRLPFGTGRTSPVDARDVAEVIATILASPTGHVGKVYELTGPQSQDMQAVAAEYSAALGRTVTYVDVPFEQWRDGELRVRHLPDHVFDHFITMAKLHAANRYDRLTHDVEARSSGKAGQRAVRDFACASRRLIRAKVEGVARQLEVAHVGLVQRRREPKSGGLAAQRGEHALVQVQAVDVGAGLGARQQHAAGAAGDVEHGAFDFTGEAHVEVDAVGEAAGHDVGQLAVVEGGWVGR